MVQILWFKKDLRLADHEALWAAAQAAHATATPILPLYICEPEAWRQPDSSGRHFAFLLESLKDLDQALQAHGHKLIYRTGGAVEIFRALHETLGIAAIYSHQETGNNYTYQRDKDVSSWAKAHHIPLHEYAQNGVIRGLKSRYGWAQKWHAQMSKPCFAIPALPASPTIDAGALPPAAALSIAADPCPERQIGGRKAGTELLQSFLSARGENYRRAISSPDTAATSGSRLSPYLSFGCLSMREVYQTTMSRRSEAPKGGWSQSLSSFTSRLHWHCHFMQKLEDEPDIEFRNFHPAYDGVRGHDARRFEAWASGQTGYPMIDACMRSLIASGWLNFRMRAMLVSFASYHLWLDWRAPALHLARLFTDYEAGIHYSQIQMQSGTTGINVMRIYNPIKQSQDQDPNGRFIRRWIPEIAHLPDHLIHTPWLVPHRVADYAPPIIEEATSRRQAATKLSAIRKTIEHHQHAAEIVKKHGSKRSGLSQAANKARQGAKARKSGQRGTQNTAQNKQTSQQGELPL